MSDPDGHANGAPDCTIEADPLMRVRLDLSYDGAGFSGWAAQPDRRTVQGVLAEALATVLRLGEVPRLTVAGRTDAGVHAVGQVAHVDLPRLLDVPGLPHPPEPPRLSHRSRLAAGEPARLLRALAGVLPPDLRVTGLRAAPPGFDARFAALWRRYRYRIDDSDTGPDPLRRGFVAARRRHLDAEAMSAAAEPLIGLHDFAAFCRARDGASTIRTLQTLRVRRSRRHRGEVIIEVRADAFCHSMVRSLVGALAAVGEGRRPLDWPAGLLARDRRAEEVSVAAAHGLTLVEVGYPPDAELAQRVARTRARRTPLPTPTPRPGPAQTTASAATGSAERPRRAGN